MLPDRGDTSGGLRGAGSTEADLNILIAEDHAPFRRSIRLLLESQPGWTVTAEVSNGRDAIDEAKRLNPDVVVLDVSMPEVDGLQATREIVKADPSAQVLILTIHDSELVAAQASLAGAKAVLSKADASITLVAAIESLQREPMHLAGWDIGRWYHIGAFFHSTAERDRVLAPFTREGLSRGDRIVHIIDAAKGDDHRHAHPHPEISLVAADDVFFRDHQFDGQTMIEGILELLRGSQRPALTRLIGFARPNDPRIIEYEARLNDLLRAFESVVICAYELSMFDSEVIVDAFRAHPAVLINEEFHKNPFYVPPELLIRELRQRTSRADGMSEA
jgi:CheY-like chemotaxis protein